jgi:hypothetical protein
MKLTYLELRDILNAMTAKQLMQEVTTYAGDIDDTMGVLGVSTNTDVEMGESMPGFDTDQIFLII